MVQNNPRVRAAYLIRTCGVSAPFTPDLERELRNAGAAESIIAAVREVAPKAGPRPGETKVNPKDGQTYVWIPPGRFTLGCSPGDDQCFDNEKRSREVSFAKGFWMGQTPVTSEAYEKYRAASGIQALKTGGRNNLNAAGNPQNPAVSMTWDEARNYCSNTGMRLPTEAEWEYAARAGTTGPRYGPLDEVAWYADNSGRERIDSERIAQTDRPNYQKRITENGNGPHPVRGKKPNDWNLYDMLGNVWEWTGDWYEEGKTRVLRGGSWFVSPRDVRVSFRLKAAPTDRTSNYGFRCVGE
jgi:formylglycine-generating enzyme required for sulfatase activity